MARRRLLDDVQWAGLLPPLGHEHINMVGRYAFSLPALPDRIARGELRPLRDPALLDKAA